MKKLLIIPVFVLAALSVHAGGITHLVDDFFQVGIYCDTHQMTFIGNRAPSFQGITVLGDVSATGDIMTVLCVVTIGDASLQSLKEKALRRLKHTSKCKILKSYLG